jgi:hypothetical protein
MQPKLCKAYSYLGFIGDTMEKKKSIPAPLVLIAIGGIILIFAVLMVISQSLFKSNASPSISSSTSTSISSPTSASSGEYGYPEIQRVSLEDAKAAFDAQSAVFIDVRDSSSYAESHIPGALNIPLNELPNHLSELNKSDWIITYCT